MGKKRFVSIHPDGVLRDTPKPVAVLTAPKACEVDVSQVEITQTPATTNALMSLQELINQGVHALDEKS
jgi:hypothetical protein